MFHFEGVNALFAKLRRAVETISTLSAADVGLGGGNVVLNRAQKNGDGNSKKPPVKVTLEGAKEESSTKEAPKKKEKKQM